MPVFKATYFFNEGQYGWTETWGVTGSDLVDASMTANALVIDLMAFRSVAVRLQSYRVSSTNYPTDRKVIHPPSFQVGQRSSIAPAGREPTQVALLCVVEYGAGQSRSILLRGLADDDVSVDTVSGAANIPAPIMTLVNQLGNQLNGLGMGFLVDDPTMPWQPVNGFAPNPTYPNSYKVQCAAGATVPDLGGPVKFKGFKRTEVPWLTGKFLAIDHTLAPNQDFTIRVPAGVQPVYSTGVNLDNAYFRNYASLVSVVQTINATDYRERKTGRPIAVTRGRAKGLRYRR